MSVVSGSCTGWQSGPDFRGTFDIVSTCFTTLLLCLWSAVHVDIPAHSGRLRGLWVRVGWIFIGLITPETLLFIAYRQWSIANDILDCANTSNAFPCSKNPCHYYSRVPGSMVEHADTEQDASIYNKKHPWTMVHSYHAAMGGFVFDTKSEEGTKSEFLPESYQPSGHVVITPEGIQFLLKHKPELLPDLSIEEISDRNKGDSISKSVLVVQVSFFLIDCIARTAQGLPITLLEVTTVAHALCSLLAYLFWWSKPLNVDRPVFIRGKEAQEMCALMCMTSTYRHYFLAGYLMIWRPAEMDSLAYDHAPHFTSPAQGVSTIVFSVRPPDGSIEDGMARWLDKTVGSWLMGRQPWYQRKKHEPGDEDKRRWQLASVAAQSLPGGMKAVEGLQTEVYPNRKCYTDALVSPTSGLSACLKHHGGDPRKFTLNEKDQGPLAAIILAILFGFPSMAAWNFIFPTSLDQMLWRVASLAAVSRGTVYWATRQIALWATTRSPNCRLVRKAASVIPVTVLMALLIPSSLILVGESFKQLWYLPPAAYQIPNLSQYWPHF
ncbi:hypothetical protein FB446DRAFT_489980 [Lentinula raphanica]|nr:hypothetical protein FB446DRAFT_489980 [Lentinula raphanica]